MLRTAKAGRISREVVRRVKQDKVNLVQSDRVRWHMRRYHIILFACVAWQLAWCKWEADIIIEDDIQRYSILSSDKIHRAQ